MIQPPQQQTCTSRDDDWHRPRTRGKWVRSPAFLHCAAVWRSGAPGFKHRIPPCTTYHQPTYEVPPTGSTHRTPRETRKDDRAAPPARICRHIEIYKLCHNQPE